MRSLLGWVALAFVLSAAPIALMAARRGAAPSVWWRLPLRALGAMAVATLAVSALLSPLEYALLPGPLAYRWRAVNLAVYPLFGYWAGRYWLRSLARREASRAAPG